MKIAIILFNLGGPDSLDAVQPFLRNLFSDPAIITLPSWLRLPLANFIARRRTPKARGIYEKIGGGSPILGQTEAQARALEEALGTEHEWRGYVCMRYWHPMTERVVQSVKRFAPDRIVLLPLYPQFSTTTTASSFAAWKKAAGFATPTVEIESYPTEPGFIRASVELVKQGLAKRAPAQNACCSRRTACRKRSSSAAIPISARSSRRPRRLPIISTASTGRSATRAGSAR
jgi:ferrochelatase